MLCGKIIPGFDKLSLQESRGMVATGGQPSCFWNFLSALSLHAPTSGRITHRLPRTQKWFLQVEGLALGLQLSKCPLCCDCSRYDSRENQCFPLRRNSRCCTRLTAKQDTININKEKVTWAGQSNIRV